MALSYFTESEAPRDFRISSTDSESHYTKCLLCYTIKKNFFCVECIKAGNFIHSSLPYSDRFADKQVKLLRLKSNRKYVQDRCEMLLLKKSKHDSLQTDVKQGKDKVELIKLAIEQRKHNIEERRKELAALKQYNTELSLKLPRYQKRVLSLGKHAQVQRNEVEKRITIYNETTESLADLRRARIRQLTKYIFPVYITYDSSDSIEDMEFLQVESEESPVPRERLHVLSAWLPADGDYSHGAVREEGAVTAPAERPGARTGAALALAAQLTALLAWTLDVRLPYPLPLSEYWVSRGAELSPAALGARACRLAHGAAALCLRARRPPPAPPAAPHAALRTLHTLAARASAGDPEVGRVSCAMSESLLSAGAAWALRWPPPEPDDEPPEHLSWPHDEMEELSCTPPAPAPAPSLVTSAAASIASMFRGWAK